MYEFCSNHTHYDLKVLKRGTSYINITLLNKNDGACLSFRDVLNYTSPCNLDSYLKQWGAKFQKSIFPHGFFSNIEDMKNYTCFPPEEAFFNTLKQKPIDSQEYMIAKKEFERRQSLCTDDPQKMNNMACWLAYYNGLDVEPLVEAISHSFEKFHILFAVDPNMELSLPSVAFKAMFNLYDLKLPYCFTFDKQRKHLRDQHRQNMLGGLSSVYHRHIDLSTDTSPVNARIGSNQKPFSHVVFLDFNRLYDISKKLLDFFFSVCIYFHNNKTYRLALALNGPGINLNFESLL